MIVSYYFLIISFSILTRVSHFSDVNNTASGINEADLRSGNKSSESDDVTQIEKEKIDNQSESRDSADPSGDRKEIAHQPGTPDTPIDATDVASDPGSVSGESGDSGKGSVDPLADENNQSKPFDNQVSENMVADSSNQTSTLHDSLTKSINENDSKSITDDMPTFDEYRQKLEKESKEKREKADSIPSSPTMILKENNVIKTTGDGTASQSVNKESPDSAKSSSSSQSTLSSSSSSSSSSSPSSSSSSSSPSSSSSSSSSNSDQKSSTNTEKAPDLIIPKNPIGAETDTKKVDQRTATLTKKLLKNNVAAKECGAKMLEFSNQITNADFVLNSNKDEYLNVPCSLTEKWFIVETCEPVQIRSIQIANFEMFSSRPKTFKVYSSDRYPVKHWYNLGLFRALDEKGIQTFTISDTNMVKYIKFEMVDHYGNEHYCPLTFVRILGNVVIDEIDEEMEDNALPLDEDIPIDNAESKVNSDGLLTKAKDILVKMVNGIGSSKKQDLDKSIEDINHMVNQLAENNSDIILSESPCYFIDFLVKEIHSTCEYVLSNFERLLSLENYLLFDDQMSVENQIISQPFPYQIRVEYFSICQRINSTNFEFNRLHRSFQNLSLHSSKDICTQRPWQNLSFMYKCNLILKKNLISSEPSLPTITGESRSSGKVVPVVVQSTVDIPNIKNTDMSFEENKSPSSNKEESSNFNGPNGYINGSPLISNETISEEIENIDKNNKIEPIGKDNRGNKSDHQVKEGDHGNIESTDSQIKSNPAKLKIEDNLDQKISASPGSNAWNQAFMRIKNMAKQLEVNVSISMKYLEELSQNYKQQTERLKKAQSLMAENMSNLENLVNQNNRETQKSIQFLNDQFQNLLLRLKYGFSKKRSKYRSKTPLNLSLESDNENKCVDLLSDDLFESSWLDSPLLAIVINVLLSIFFNMVFLMLIYHRLKAKMMQDIEKAIHSSMKSTHDSMVDFTIIEDIPKTVASRSCGDLTYKKLSPHPIVLPPRGVNLSFINSGCDSDDGDKIHKKALEPHFYTVQPNLNFVTPSKFHNNNVISWKY